MATFFLVSYCKKIICIGRLSKLPISQTQIPVHLYFLVDSDIYDNGRPWGFEWISTEISNYANDKNTAGDSRPDWLQV